MHFPDQHSGFVSFKLLLLIVEVIFASNEFEIHSRATCLSFISIFLNAQSDYSTCCTPVYMRCERVRLTLEDDRRRLVCGRGRMMAAIPIIG